MTDLPNGERRPFQEAGGRDPSGGRMTAAAAPGRAFYGARVGRYIVAAIGPAAVAGTNFLLSFCILRLETPATFGAFTFLFAAAWFGISLSNALFGAPLQVAGVGEAADKTEMETTVLSSATLTMLILGPAFALLGVGFGLIAWQALSYALFGMLTMLRCVGRAWSYAADRPWQVARSDIGYAVATAAAFAALVGLVHIAPHRAVYPALAIGMAAGVASFGTRFAGLVLRPRRAALSRYGAIWRMHSRWSLFSVATTEAVSNAHIYLLTLFMGSAAVAPVAASAMLVRPINVIQNALIEYERPQMARYLRKRETGELRQSRRLFLVVMLLVWGGTVVLGGAILVVWPGLVFPAGYSRQTLRLAAASWAVLSLVIAVQAPDNVLLQAAGAFQTLARASMRASVVSVTGVLVAIALRLPVLTVAAIVLGWLVSTAFVRRATRDYRSRTKGGRPSTASGP